MMIGGRLVKQNQYPWNVALIHNEHGLFCGGTVISNKHILTAAHCMRGKKGSHEFGICDFTVQLGVHNYREPEEPGRITMSVKSINIHEDYNIIDRITYYDIAVLELTSEINFSLKILPICLANKKSTVATAREGITVGFGITENNAVSDIARELNVPIRNYHECINESGDHQMFANPTTFCAGPANGSGVCSGDSGSGVYVEKDDAYYILGIVSTALMKNGECDVHKQAIFTNVTRYYDWIKRFTDLN